MRSSAVRVIDARGEVGTLVPESEQGESVGVRLTSGALVHIPSRLLEPADAGGYRLRAAFAGLQDAPVGSTGAVQEEVIPISEEALVVGKRVRETGRVRIHKHVQERTEVVDEPLLHEEVEVERVPVNRVLSDAPQIRHEGDVMIIPIVEERYVVHKQLVLKEELRVTRRRTERHAPQEVTLRSETVEVERLPIGAATERLERREG